MPGEPHQRDHETSPAEFLDADQRAYQDAAAVRNAARQAAIDDEEHRQSSYPQARRVLRRQRDRQRGVG